MTIYIGIDDTDTETSRGTGRLARSIADELAPDYQIIGVSRHQLYVHDDIPYTSHNSAAVIHMESQGNGSIRRLHTLVRDLMMSDFIEGSDPGLCIIERSRIVDDIISFGGRAKTGVLTQDEARWLASGHQIILEGLGGTEDGVIGALAGVGLAASGNDGRYVMKAKTRTMTGSRTVGELLDCGIDRIITEEGALITEGRVSMSKFPKPALVGGQAVLIVSGSDGVYRDLVVG
ncbi:ABC transporter substrate-binding protein [Methanocalculus chunghsingensis]|uniref:ABC transporter substrate-binding protein n=1 Tax=Methanocalculus chunghsingensis TaxID=156457 RepID=A0A8J7W4H8_9EURY|nr:ABC transporter substrate-binding protein [Methanocalculus chunghsingensis]MBR1368041.1 ABC transporter substrate-binding protein [Methanocalculus chunghsingensis]